MRRRIFLSTCLFGSVVVTAYELGFQHQTYVTSPTRGLATRGAPLSPVAPPRFLYSFQSDQAGRVFAPAIWILEWSGGARFGSTELRPISWTWFKLSDAPSLLTPISLGVLSVPPLIGSVIAAWLGLDFFQSRRRPRRDN